MAGRRGVDFCVCGGYTIGVDNVYRPNAICLLKSPVIRRLFFVAGDITPGNLSSASGGRKKEKGNK
jgi:hypothetical protein